MATASITDQLGAVALIDAMRGQQLAIEEYLDLGKRRTDVAAKIREYYAALNCPVDDAMIEAGVRSYFDKRLVFSTPSVAPIKQRLISAYVTRHLWIKQAMLGAAGVATACAITAGGMNLYHRVELSGIEDAVSQVNNKESDLMKRESALRNQYNGIKSKLMQFPMLAATAIIDRQPKNLGTIATERLKAIRLKVTDSNKEEIKTLVARSVVAVGLLDKELNAIEQDLVAAQSMSSINQEFMELTNRPDYRQVRMLSSMVRDNESAVKTAISAPDSSRHNLPGAFNVLKDQVASFPIFTARMEKLEEIKAKFTAMKLPSNDAERVAAIATSALKEADRFDLNQLSSKIETLQTLLAFAEKPLQLQIIDRVGEKSGVERKYKESGGKSWYAIVEALDSDGVAVPVDVSNVESGTRKEATKFGIRIDFETYSKIKKQKLETGHVQDRELGVKPANSLSFQYIAAIAKKPDVITDW